MTDTVQVGKLIQKLRKDKGLTQVQVAERMNISYQAVSKWESGTSLPDSALLMDIASILETSVDSILNGGKPLMTFEKRMAVKDIQKGVQSLAELGALIGRDTTIYIGAVEGINTSMNIDVEEMFSQTFLLEGLTAECIIQNMLSGRYVDISDIKSNLQYEKWMDIVCEYASRLGIQ